MKKIIAIFFCLFVLFGCANSENRRTGIGAGVGAAVGAGLGAIIGHQSGNRDKGALVGAALGGMIGGGVGAYLDQQAKELAAIAETRRTEHGIITKLKGDILFDTNKSALKGNAKGKIDQIAAIIVKYPEDRVRVVGHTDGTGEAEYNANLSVKRAEAVYQRLVARGIPAEFVEASGMGETQPVASNATNQGRSLNRRVELEISVDEEAYKQKNKRRR